MTEVSSGLCELLEWSHHQGDVDPKAFARIVFGGEEELAVLLRTNSSSLDETAYVRAAIAILYEATKINSSEEQLLRWFRHERLALFANRTPAEAISRGDSAGLLAYVESLDAGWTG